MKSKICHRGTLVSLLIAYKAGQLVRAASYSLHGEVHWGVMWDSQHIVSVMSIAKMEKSSYQEAEGGVQG